MPRVAAVRPRRVRGGEPVRARPARTSTCRTGSRAAWRSGAYPAGRSAWRSPRPASWRTPPGRRGPGTLRELHILLAIDDFGTGYSSLSYLSRLPVHEIKIDKSFVHGMLGDGNDRIVVRSTIDLARNLGLHVVAEGVEDDAQWELLSSFGCRYVQGYHVGRPEPESEQLRRRLVHDRV